MTMPRGMGGAVWRRTWCNHVYTSWVEYLVLIEFFWGMLPEEAEDIILEY